MGIEVLTPGSPRGAFVRAAGLLCAELGPQYTSGEELRTLAESDGLIAVVDGEATEAVATARVLGGVEARAFTDRWPELDSSDGDLVGLAEASAVAPGGRGRGLGTMLGALRYGWLVGKGATLVCAVSWRSGSNESYRLWERVGLTHVADRDHYWQRLGPGHCPRCAARCECTASLMARRIRPQR